MLKCQYLKYKPQQILYLILLIDYKLLLELFYFSDHGIVDDLLNVILKLKKGTIYTRKDWNSFFFFIIFSQSARPISSFSKLNKVM